MNKFLSISYLIFVTCIVQNNLVMGMHDAPAGDGGKDPVYVPTGPVLRVTKRTKPILVDQPSGDIEYVIARFGTLKVKTPEDVAADEKALAIKFREAYDAIEDGNLDDLKIALAGIAPERIHATRICDIKPSSKACYYCCVVFFCVCEVVSGGFGYKVKRSREGSLLQLALTIRIASKTPASLEIINYLLHLNFDLNITNYFISGDDEAYHGSALHMAVIGDGDSELLRLLLGYRNSIGRHLVNIDTPNNGGKSAVVLAAQEQNQQAVTMLLGDGAKPT